MTDSRKSTPWTVAYPLNVNAFKSSVNNIDKYPEMGALLLKVLQILSIHFLSVPDICNTVLDFPNILANVLQICLQYFSAV